MEEEDGRRFASNGGQRTVTVLIYLNDVAQGGATSFPSCHLQVQPRQGMALVFFPASIDGALDRRALHAALPAIDTKYVSQIWIRQGNYYGQPSKRLAVPLGTPFPGTPTVPLPIPVPMVPQTDTTTSTPAAAAAGPNDSTPQPPPPQRVEPMSQ
jgi:hypothetical protein